MGAFGPRISGARVAREHPYVFLATIIVAAAVFVVACEAFITYCEGAPFAGSRDSILALVYARAPVSILASTLLTAAWVAKRTRGREKVSDAPPAIPNGGERQPMEAKYGAADVIDVMTGTGRATIRMAEIECFRADRNYITVTHSSRRSYLLRQTMGALERSLDASRFLRVHRSTIVNREMVAERRRNGVLVLKSGQTVRISRACRGKIPS
jgi:DNA-binding LytR/AlgR family response regulator